MVGIQGVIMAAAVIGGDITAAAGVITTVTVRDITVGTADGVTGIIPAGIGGAPGVMPIRVGGGLIRLSSCILIPILTPTQTPTPMMCPRRTVQ